MTSLSALLNEIKRARPEVHWDLCDAMRYTPPTASGCPLGAGATGGSQCRACPLNCHADWLEELHHEAH